MLKAGGKDLLMLIMKRGESCLWIAAHTWHVDIGKLRQGE